MLHIVNRLLVLSRLTPHLANGIFHTLHSCDSTQRVDFQYPTANREYSMSKYNEECICRDRELAIHAARFPLDIGVECWILDIQFPEHCLLLTSNFLLIPTPYLLPHLHRAFGDGGQEQPPVPLGDDSRIEHDDHALVARRPDQAADALAEFEDGFRQ